jgi:hypothetical protein
MDLARSLNVYRDKANPSRFEREMGRGYLEAVAAQDPRAPAARA